MQTTIEKTGQTFNVALTKRTGLVAGTTVLTLKGEMKVEDLQIGDRIITRDAGMAVLKGIAATEVTMTPIKIKAGSLGHNRPEAEMLTSPDTLIHIRDWRAQALFGKSPALVPARRLVDGEFISQAAKAQVKIFDLKFDRQHIIYADGVEVATTEV